MQKNKITLNNEHRLIYLFAGETPSGAETPRDAADKPDSETYEQKLERFQNARKAIDKEISETDDPELKQKLQKEYDAFLSRGSDLYNKLKGSTDSREEIITKCLSFLEEFKTDQKVDELKKRGEDELSAMLRATKDEGERNVLSQAAYELRGASRAEAKQQIMLRDKYDMGTAVSKDGVPAMWPAMTNPRTVQKALDENPDLEVRIRSYLEGYLRSEKK